MASGLRVGGIVGIIFVGRLLLAVVGMVRAGTSNWRTLSGGCGAAGIRGVDVVDVVVEEEGRWHDWTVLGFGGAGSRVLGSEEG